MQRLIKTICAVIGSILVLMIFAAASVSLYQYRHYQGVLEGKRVQMESDIPRYKVAPHVIRIDITLPTGSKFSGGTGFYLKYQDKTVIMTNKHICDPTLSGLQLRHDGEILEVIHIDEHHDLCLVKSNRKEGLKLASLFSIVDLMDHVILVGHPRGLPLTIREGRIMDFDSDIFPWVGKKPINYFMISTTTYGGNSGSPVTNVKGQVIGVLFAGFRNYHTESFVVPLVNIHVLLRSKFELY